jgi:outer membrane protein OmpA-like peptidoglycan-associated protein
MLPAGPEGSAVDLKQAAGTPATPASPETPKQTIVATAPAPTATDAAPVAASSIEATAAVYTPRVVPSAPGEDLPSSLGLPVRFAFDSARILPEAYRQLDAVAEGIKLADPRINVVIEGHTDAAGTAPYNLRLSSQRADAVRTYLITRHGVDPRRLRVVGMGEFAPLDKTTPYAPENRRVEFRSEG